MNHKILYSLTTSCTRRSTRMDARDVRSQRSVSRTRRRGASGKANGRATPLRKSTICIHSFTKEADGLPRYVAAWRPGHCFFNLHFFGFFSLDLFPGFPEPVIICLVMVWFTSSSIALPVGFLSLAFFVHPYIVAPSFFIWKFETWNGPPCKPNLCPFYLYPCSNYLPWVMSLFLNDFDTHLKLC